MSSNLNSSARPFQPEVSSSEKAQLQKFSNQLEDNAEITRLREDIMKERAAKEARQISQSALLPRAALQNTQMLRSFQPPVMLPSPSTSLSTSPPLEFNKYSTMPYSYFHNLEQPRSFEEQQLDPNFVKRRPQQLSFSQLMTLPLPKSASASSQLRLEEPNMSESPFVPSQARPIRMSSSSSEGEEGSLLDSGADSDDVLSRMSLSSEGYASLPSRVSSSSFQEPDEIISQEIISKKELQSIDKDIADDLANELKNAGVVKAPISVSMAQQRRAFVPAASAEQAPAASAEQAPAASAEQAAAAAAAARESMAAAALAQAQAAEDYNKKGWFKRFFNLKGGKHSHHRRKKSKSALSRKKLKRYSVKAKKHRNRRKSRR
jgi:hypothetical protein